MFCRKFCTRKLGWDSAKRDDCRKNTACTPFREFWPVTGSDFARSFKWAKGQVNPVQQQIRSKLNLTATPFA